MREVAAVEGADGYVDLPDLRLAIRRRGAGVECVDSGEHGGAEVT